VLLVLETSVPQLAQTVEEDGTRVAEGTELDGESKPVVRTALLPDAREITLA
jgi:hypothetical protein